MMWTYSISIIYTVVFCTDGDLRLMGGARDGEGRVEICIGETWGTICDDLWSNLDAQVACRKLGYSKIGSYVRPIPAL